MGMNALALFPGYLRVGPLHLPVFGLFAAAGLVCALWLSQRTARYAALSPERLWDAGMFALLAAFIASRALLVAPDPKAFARFPLLILTLPSLTYSGIAVTIVLTFLWLRIRHMPVMNVADAWAPCAAILWAFLSQGHFVEGTEAGMPTTLPWGIKTPGDHVLGRVHPVQLYTFFAALLLCLYLMRQLKRKHRMGEVAALGFFLGGAASFLLDMVRQPVDIEAGLLLDPSQFLAIATMLVGAGFTAAFGFASVLKREEVALYLERFIKSEGTLSPHLMRDTVFSDPLLVETQSRFLDLPRDYPSQNKAWCSRAGLEVLEWYVTQLRHSPAPHQRKAS